jgi:Glycogen debranching enzyme
VFRHSARRLQKGLIPNRIPDSYHSSDASLWFMWALEEYRRMGGREDFLAEMKPVVEEILSRYGESEVATLEGELIRVAPQSTWMDTAYTPREGKPVEVNALWIHALACAPAWDLDPPLRPTGFAGLSINSGMRKKDISVIVSIHVIRPCDPINSSPCPWALQMGTSK